MQTIKIISDIYLKSITPVNLNVDEKDLTIHIIPSQDLFIQPILGTNLYNEIMLAYSAQTLTADQITLVEYIKPVVAFKTLEKALPFLTFNIKNKGLQAQNGDFSSSVTLTEMNVIKNELNNLYEFYAQRLIVYLRNNSTLYPLYINDTNVDLSPDTDTAYNCGIVFYKNGNC